MAVTAPDPRPRVSLLGPIAITIGWVIALLVLIAVLVLWITGQLSATQALLFGGLAVARLV